MDGAPPGRPGAGCDGPGRALRPAGADHGGPRSQPPGPPGRRRSDPKDPRGTFKGPTMNPSPRFTVLAESCRRLPPRVALVLGSGMGRVARRLEDPLAVP